MELSKKQIKQFARLIMPELYEMQAGCDMWTEAIAKVCKKMEEDVISAMELPE